MKKILKNKRSLQGLVLILAITMTVVFSIGAIAFADTDDDETTAAKSTNVNDGVSTVSKTPEDTETVYFITDANGNENQRIVSEDGTLHYKGYEDCQAPVTVSIAYELDGNDISPEDLAGASGHLTMTINYKNNIKSGGVYVPFMAMTGMIFDDKNFSNIKVTNGKATDDGSKSIVLGYGFPGVEESLGVSSSNIDIPSSVTVTADVKEYKMDIMYTVVTNKVFADLNLNEVKDVNDLKSKMGQLTDGIDQLVSGTSTLYKGTSKLSTGVTQLTAGTDKLKSGSKTLYDGSTELAVGSKKLASGTKSLTSGTSKLASGAKTLKSGTTTLTSGTKNLVSGVKTLSAGTEKLKKGSSDLKDGATTVNGGLQKVTGKATGTDNSEKLRQAAQSILNSSLQQANSELAPLISAGAIQTLTTENYVTQLAKAKAYFTSQSDAAKAAKMDVVKEQITSLLENYKGVVAYTKGVDQVAAGTGKLATGAQAVDKGVADLQKGEKDLTSGSQTLNQGAKKLDAGATELQTGINGLKNGAATLNTAATKLNGGIASLKSGAFTLYNGTTTLREKENDLVDGIDQLNAGAKKLNDGVNQMADQLTKALSKLDVEQLADAIDNINAMGNAAKSYDSFGGKGSYSQVTFIYKADEVSPK